MPGMPPFGGDEISQLMHFLKSQPQLIVCGRLGLQRLSDARRRELLAGVNLFDALETVARLQGRWDVAYTTTQRPDVAEADFLAGGAGEACRRARKQVAAHRDMLVSPRATAQLQREIIEYASADEAAPSIDLNLLVHMLLSVTSEQNMRPEFASDVPTDADVAKLERVVPTMGLEETLEYAKTIIPDEVASSLFNLPLKLEIVLSNTDDVWFTAWPSRSKTTGLGATPAEAFKIATGIELLDMMRLGHRIIKRSTAQRQVRFTRDELIADGATEAAIDYLFANMSLPLDDFKVKLQADRDAGAIGHQRYTLTQFPFLAVDDNTFVMLRHQWALDRLCGGQLYFEVWFKLSTQSGRLGHRFKVGNPDVGLDMTRFPTPAHLVSWARLCPRTIQSGPVTRGGKTGKGNPYLKGALGEAAAAAARTDTFLGERYRRLVKRRGRLKALVAVARSILVVIWHLLADPAARFRDLGPDYHTNRLTIEKRLRNHIAQLAAMGYRVTVEPAA